MGDDALSGHQFKRYIDNIVDYGKQGEGLTGYAEKIIKGARRGIDQTLDTNFVSYNQANQLYSQSIGVLDDISRLVGKDLVRKGGEFGNVKSGMVMRRLLSNSANRADLLQMLDNMEGLVTSNGYKSQESIINQVVFADMMEDMFGNQARTGLQSQVQKGTEKALNKFGTGYQPTMIGAAKDALIGGYKFATQKTPQMKLEALMELLK